MKKTIWSENYKIASYFLNLRNQAGLYAMLNLIQDVGWLHGVHLKVNLPTQHGWVFTRQKLTMETWPSWNQTVTLRTWLRPPIERFFYRDYEILIGDQIIGKGTSTFAVMDLSTRKLANISWDHDESIWRTEGCHKDIPEKITLHESGSSTTNGNGSSTTNGNGSSANNSSEMKDLTQFLVRHSDLDMNQHVNNTKYAQWILDSLPLEVLQGTDHLYSYEVNFLAEAKSEDIIKIQQASSSEVNSESQKVFQTHRFQGLREADQKSVFRARLISRRSI